MPNIWDDLLNLTEVENNGSLDCIRDIFPLLLFLQVLQYSRLKGGHCLTLDLWSTSGQASLDYWVRLVGFYHIMLKTLVPNLSK
jgi:hypothetical protein